VAFPEKEGKNKKIAQKLGISRNLIPLIRSMKLAKIALLPFAIIFATASTAFAGAGCCPAMSGGESRNHEGGPGFLQAGFLPGHFPR
jgi:hypothetical protein